MITLSLEPQKGHEIADAADAGCLFAVIDGCDEESVHVLVAERDGHLVSLYRGTELDGQDDVAPFFGRVDRDLLAWIESEIGASPWGILASSSSDFETLFAHFQGLLSVESPEGEPWYFRYYDPRVLVTFLPACGADELSRFCGPVDVFWAPGQEAGQYSRLERPRWRRTRAD